MVKIYIEWLDERQSGLWEREGVGVRVGEARRGEGQEGASIEHE